MQKYPDLKLQPTSVYSWQSNYKSNFWGYLILTIYFILIFVLVASIIGIIVSIYTYGINDFVHHPDGGLSLMIFGIALPINIILYFIIKWLKSKFDNFNKNIKPTLPKLADYIQEYKYGGSKQHPKYVFFVKDNKFGVMNVTEFKVAIAAQYDEIAWREPNRILTVTKGNETYDIDIFGNQLR